ncbi:LysR family transcriptional regulator [Metabacillus arenae]|uniref:LysR family transcriptional regulator n=1 Tax=Metabacillus arenae TaxID=2771434 RepID=A0A926RZY6_9BACI|nr:LysR family transcriptional regulator [Metabacillus arenae]MBD1383330.1 LysR family transcriptional regulator [Metabacillus arenae]
MYYDALRTFVTLAEIGNFTKAAEQLCISQPSVSLHIKNLEKEFDTELFLRSPKFLKITPTGEILYERAKQILSIYEQARQDILEHHNDVKGKLKIGASFTIGEYILPSLLADLQTEFPGLDFEVLIGNTDEIAQSVRLFEVDIGLIEGQTNEKELTIHSFKEDVLFIVGSNNDPLASKKGVKISDLQDQAWITREEGSGTREYLDHVIRSNGLKVKSLYSISSTQGIKESVMHGMGLSLLSQSVIEREIQHNYLSIIPVKNQSFKRTLSYVYSPAMKSKRNVEIFIEALIKKWTI